METALALESPIWQLLLYVGGFVLVAVASDRIAGLFQKLKLPLITGFLIIGLLSGPGIFGLIRAEAVDRLHFINDVALAFIAYAVGSEMYLGELRSRMKSILTLVAFQVFFTFVMVSLAMFFVIRMLPFLREMSLAARVAVSLLAGTIAIARSPASAIAVINELRARGPFTQTAIGVTVIKDFGVVVLFAVIFTLSKAMIQGEEFRMVLIVQVLVELMFAFGLGVALGFVLKLLLSLKGGFAFKKGMVLGLGFGVYGLSHLIAHLSEEGFGMAIHLEPLLVCIIGSFLVTNYTVYRNDFIRIVKQLGPYVYVVFFTFTGASIELNVLTGFWYVTLILFSFRVLSLFLAGFGSALVTKEPPLFRRILWMPFVTQAGVGVGLASIIAGEFPGWGNGFATLVISVIVLNELFGPPLFKWALHLAGEVHVRADGSFDAEKKVLIFGWESQSLALGRQLKSQGWKVELAVTALNEEIRNCRDFPIHEFHGTDHQALRKFTAETADTMVFLLSDEENRLLCETAYEHFGTRHLIVRLNDRVNYKQHTDGGHGHGPPDRHGVPAGAFCTGPHCHLFVAGDGREPGFHRCGIAELGFPWPDPARFAVAHRCDRSFGDPGRSSHHFPRLHPASTR
ncbi:MAG: cation:proton antiporter [Bacteroidales bacterium]